MPAKAKPRAVRFWSKVKKVDGEGCWEWQSTRTPDTGYGLFGVRWHPPRYVVAHRISYELNCGPIPAGMKVCHKCDNPPCVRPDHLFLGTQRSNIEDMRRKGRAARGTKHFRAKLDPDKVRDVRRALVAGETVKNIARRHKVRPGTIYAVRDGKTWTHIPSEAT